MHSLNERQMLTIWEHGLDQPMLQRALVMLMAAYPEISPDQAAKLSIGVRDSHLFRLREQLFGSRIHNSAKCPCCKEQVEWENEVADICIPMLPGVTSSERFMLEVEGYRICFRLPSSIDIAEIMNRHHNNMISNALLAQCVLSVEKDATPMDVQQIPEHAIQALELRLDELDPQAQINIDLTCPGCTHQWKVLFDIVSFLWQEINHWAERMLQAIHALARGYGWSEEEILNLSPVRRQLYLGMLGV